jgi:hypothetical protein
VGECLATRKKFLQVNRAAGPKCVVTTDGKVVSLANRLATVGAAWKKTGGVVRTPPVRVFGIGLLLFFRRDFRRVEGVLERDEVFAGLE